MGVMVDHSSRCVLPAATRGWLVSNGLLGDFLPPTHSLPNEDIVIIGAGISGAPAAHELCRAGFRCTMIDRRLVSAGRSWASTAQLNYEIDVSLSDLAKQSGDAAALSIYQSGPAAVARVGETLAEAGVDAGYEHRGSLYLASDRRGAKEATQEYALRKQHGIPAELLDEEALRSECRKKTI